MSPRDGGADSGAVPGKHALPESPEANYRLPEDAAERGTLQIDPAVVRKIAQHTADVMPDIVARSRRLAGLEMGEKGSNAKVGGSGSVVDVSLEIGLRYPSDVRAVVSDLRDKVRQQIGESTGYRIRSLDILVTSLQSESGTIARVQ
ncbi:MAG: Asp23/Gls24 family envelope stress response protein [Sciscionella sp.]